MTCERCGNGSDDGRAVRARSGELVCWSDGDCECPHYLCDSCFEVLLKRLATGG